MKVFLFLFFIAFSIQLFSQQILPESERARVVDEVLEERFNTLLPKLMDDTGIDMWILISREYNEDPVLKTMLPSNWLNARRTTILIVYNTGEGIETLACARYQVGETFTKAWDKDTQPDQWAQLREIIEERDPKQIGINRSEHFGLADGLRSFHYLIMISYLPKIY